jgi:ABC-2 type transport system permease protein
LPPTLRGVLLDHVLRADLMLTGLAINSLLFAAAAVGFAWLLASARRAGTQMGE